MPISDGSWAGLAARIEATAPDTASATRSRLVTRVGSVENTRSTRDSDRSNSSTVTPCSPTSAPMRCAAPAAARSRAIGRPPSDGSDPFSSTRPSRIRSDTTLVTVAEESAQSAATFARVVSPASTIRRSTAALLRWRRSFTVALPVIVPPNLGLRLSLKVTPRQPGNRVGSRPAWPGRPVPGAVVLLRVWGLRCTYGVCILGSYVGSARSSRPPQTRPDVRLSAAGRVRGVHRRHLAGEHRAGLYDAVVSRARRSWLLVLDAMIFQAEAEVRWLDHCEASLVRYTAPPATMPRVVSESEVETAR